MSSTGKNLLLELYEATQYNLLQIEFQRQPLLSYKRPHLRYRRIARELKGGGQC